MNEQLLITILSILLGTGGIAAIITPLFNKKKVKAESNQIGVSTMIDNNQHFYDRIGSLEQRIAELERRIAELEQLNSDLRIDKATLEIELKKIKYEKERLLDDLMAVREELDFYKKIPQFKVGEGE